MLARAAVLFAIAAASATASARAPTNSAQASPTRTDSVAAAALAARVDSLRQSLRIPGLALVVLRDTTIVLARGFGFADVERRVPVTPITPFNIASVAKPISAVLALQLVERGLLDLDRPMRRYANFPEFCENARANGGAFFGDYDCLSDRFTLRHVLSMSANGTAGTRFWYNPPSYSWASRPMAEVTNVPFSTLVDSLVLRPADMRNAARVFCNCGIRLPIYAALHKN